ncbi:hypothetical protein [Streptomyces ossamyceticus]|uniref:hypothetical protein n=1 Tax=Streptomyces ossamyceticus TaxID=249581 RepID=UPI000A4191E7|nr:hypothetical protein [Streptomyces ossamyceticus]
MTGSADFDGDGAVAEYRSVRDAPVDRRSVRRAMSVDVRGAHIGLVATAMAVVVVATLGSLGWAWTIAGCFGAWYSMALLVARLRDWRGWNAVRRAYVATFGWGDYITP